MTKMAAVAIHGKVLRSLFSRTIGQIALKLGIYHPGV